MTQTPKTVLLVGKPNSGKTLLFNRLTGMSQKVANFPGVTVEVKRGVWKNIDVIDHPGMYSLSALTKDEDVAVATWRQAVGEAHVALIVCVLDGTRLKHSLVLALQVLQESRLKQKRVMLAINMKDELSRSGSKIDVEGLSRALDVPILEFSAKTTEGLQELEAEMLQSLDDNSVGSSSMPMVNGHMDLVSKAQDLVETYVQRSDFLTRRQRKIDRFVLNSWLGGLFFVFVMAVLFQSIFSWSEPLMAGVEFVVEQMASITSSLLPSGLFQDFVSEAIFGGIGSFLVFVPQIFVLTLIIGLLEDSGYLARASLVCHRPLQVLGLTGKSFVPFLSGHACAIPAILAARTIDSPRRRLITILTLPLAACSARLPVYGLFIAVLIPRKDFLWGLLGSRGLTLMALYLFGLLMAAIVSFVLDRFVLKRENDLPFVMELPPYRLPHLRPLLLRSLSTALTFIKKAGGIIFLVTVVVWVLGYFPQGSGNLQHSYLASLGRVIEPIFQPLGLDWMFGVAVIASFLAREVFVGTMGTFFGIEGADEAIGSLATAIASTGFSFASGVALLVFYAIALQCVSTVAVLKQETDSSRWAWGAALGYGILAYAMAFLTYNLLTLWQA